MTTDEQLEERLAAAAELAPNPGDLAAAARRSASRMRHRQLVVGLVSLSVMVVAGAGAAMALTGHEPSTSRVVTVPDPGPCDDGPARREALGHLAVMRAVLRQNPPVQHLYVSTGLVSSPSGDAGEVAEGTMSRAVQECLAERATDLPPISFVTGFDDPAMPTTKEAPIPTVKDGTFLTFSAVPTTGSEVVVSGSQNTGGGFGYSGGQYRVRIEDDSATVVQEITRWIS